MLLPLTCTAKNNMQFTCSLVSHRNTAIARCIDGSRMSSVLQWHHNLWNVSVMIMPMLLFRYFGTCVNSCCITFVLHNGPFLHVVKQSKPFESMAYHYTIHHHTSSFHFISLATQAMLLFDKNSERFPVFEQNSLLDSGSVCGPI